MSDGAAPALRLQGVTKHYGGRPVLRDIDLDVAPGQTVAVLGANGAGKSTLLRIAAAVCRPDHGTVSVAGVPSQRDAHVARRAIGYVAQDPALYDELTPTQHIRFWARLTGAQVDPASHLEGAGLAVAAHRPCAGLSRGQRQRLALAMAFLDAPGRSLYVLDEPFTALDGQGQEGLAAGLAALRKHGTAALLALHDEAQARRHADRVLRLAHHRLEAA